MKASKRPPDAKTLPDLLPRRNREQPGADSWVLEHGMRVTATETQCGDEEPMGRMEHLELEGPPGGSLSLWGSHDGERTLLWRHEVFSTGWTVDAFEELARRVAELQGVPVRFPRRQDWRDWEADRSTGKRWAMERREAAYVNEFGAVTVEPKRSPQIDTDLERLHWPGVASVSRRTIRLAMPLGWRDFELRDVVDVRIFFDRPESQNGQLRGWFVVQTEQGIFECSPAVVDDEGAAGLLWLAERAREAIPSAGEGMQPTEASEEMAEWVRATQAED